MGLVNHLIHKLESKGHHSLLAQPPLQSLPSQQQQQQQQGNFKYDRPAMPLPNDQQVFEHVESNLKDLHIDEKNNIFTLMSTPDVSQFFKSSKHPVQLPHSTYEAFANKRPIQSPIETNSFYTNLLLDDQTAPIWTHPYSLWYTNKKEEREFYGLAFSHTTKEQRVFGGNPEKPNETQYYFNPAGIKSFIIGAVEFDKSVAMSVDGCEKFSCNINLFQQNGSIKIPVVQGMGFITSIYTNLKPKIESGIGILKFEQDSGFRHEKIKKYKVTLFNQITWSMYCFSKSSQDFEFRLESPTKIVGNVQDCTIQFASGYHELYDSLCGGYPTLCKISATVKDDTANYRFNYQVEGTSDTTIMYALPHHIESFSSEMNNKRCSGLVLDSTVAGTMQLYTTDKFSMIEKLPKNIAFEPWLSLKSLKLNNYSQELLNSIRKLCLEDINDDLINISNTDSMYSSGKILDKYCMILYVIVFILKDEKLGKQYLPRVKEAMVRFASNQQQCPLVYDTTWKGLISSAGLDGDIFKDFGNTHYNDHHFHYGYHIHAAAVLAKCDLAIGDGSFLQKYRKSIDFLVKDVANPVKDSQFPESRSFDWFNGHSWAKGLFASFDGKDEESSSEDYHFAYGLKLWGIVTNDQNLQDRGDLMLAIMKRAMNMYMLFKDDNKVQPPQMIKNKVSGILFENKVDHATYFGLNLEYIQGIHMLPITPISSFIRDPEFVRQEWEQLLQNHVKTLNDGWKGILMLNLALYDPQQSFQFFNASNFDKRWLDNGMSLTWCLAFTAGVGGSN